MRRVLIHSYVTWWCAQRNPELCQYVFRHRRSPAVIRAVAGPEFRAIMVSEKKGALATHVAARRVAFDPVRYKAALGGALARSNTADRVLHDPQALPCLCGL